MKFDNSVLGYECDYVDCPVGTEHEHEMTARDRQQWDDRPNYWMIVKAASVAHDERDYAKSIALGEMARQFAAITHRVLSEPEFSSIREADAAVAANNPLFAGLLRALGAKR